MKIGIAAPLSLAAVNGGVRTQVLQTAHHLGLLGLEIEFIRFNQLQYDYDLVHVFCATPETIGIAKQTVDKGIKLVVSPIFFSTSSANKVSSALKVEKIVSLFGSGIRSDFGIKSEICNSADAILPNTNSELKLVRDGLNVNATKLHLVPNGVESRFKDAAPDQFITTYGIKNFVLFVGQAGAPRKNVLQLLRAASKIHSQIVIIGDFYENEYSKKCLKIASSAKNVLLINNMEHNNPLLESAYAACKVFCLPSFYETPGIAALEAGLAGANIVITKQGGTQEYFGNLALFIDTKSVDNITATINKSLQSDCSTELAQQILNNYTWEVLAKKTKQVYISLF